MFSEQNKGLYRKEFEHDSCGIGFIADLNGKKSSKIVKNAIHMLERMEHRGGTGFDKASGDGAGILIQVPDTFLRKDLKKQGIELPALNEYGVGVIFFPREAQLKQQCKSFSG